jgi:hypothetical protein
MRFIDSTATITVGEVIDFLKDSIEVNVDEGGDELFFLFANVDKYISGARYLDNLGLLLLETSTDRADAIAAKQLINDLKKFEPDLKAAVQCGWIIKPILDMEELDADDYCNQKGIIQLIDYGGDGDIRLRKVWEIRGELAGRVVCLDENGVVYSLHYYGKDSGCSILQASKDNDIHQSMRASDFDKLEESDCLAIRYTKDGENYVLRAIEAGPFGYEGYYADEDYYEETGLKSFVTMRIGGEDVAVCLLGDIICGEDHNSVIDTPRGDTITSDAAVNYLKNWYLPYLKYRAEEEADLADDESCFSSTCRVWADVLQWVVNWLEITLDTGFFYGSEILNYLKKGYIPHLKSIAEKESDKAARYNEDSETAIECSSRAEALQRIAEQLEIILSGVDDQEEQRN